MISVGSHLQDLIIYKDTCVPALVVVFLPLLLLLLLFQLLLLLCDQDSTGKLLTRRSLEGAVEQFTVNMKEAKQHSTLKKAIAVSKPAMVKFQHEHVTKFQIAVSIVFHKVVDPTVGRHPPVVLTSEMVAVYTDAAPPCQCELSAIEFQRSMNRMVQTRCFRTLSPFS